VCTTLNSQGPLSDSTTRPGVKLVYNVLIFPQNEYVQNTQVVTNKTIVEIRLRPPSAQCCPRCVILSIRRDVISVLATVSHFEKAPSISRFCLADYGKDDEIQKTESALQQHRQSHCLRQHVGLHIG